MTDLVERLREAARQSSEFSRRMAEDKSARNRAAGDEGANYGWAAPEQTLEGQAAARIEALEKEALILRARDIAWALELGEARADERERCAKVAEHEANFHFERIATTCHKIAAAIRDDNG